MSDPYISEVSNNTVKYLYASSQILFAKFLALQFQKYSQPFILKLHLWIFVRVKRWLDSPSFGAIAYFLHFATNATRDILCAMRSVILNEGAIQLNDHF